MSYTDSTANLKLPQWQENDYPSWLNDVNGAFRSIDENAGEQDATIQQALNDASEARTLATKASNDVASLSGEVNSVKNEVGEVRELATTASSTASSAMDVAEIAQDTVEEVAGRTANISTNQLSFDHVVNGANRGQIVFNDTNTTIFGSNASFTLSSHDNGNLQTQNASGNIIFDGINVLTRLAALEKYTVTVLTPFEGISGYFALTRIGRICVLSIWGLAAGTPGYASLCEVPDVDVSVGAMLSNASGEPLALAFKDPQQPIKINKTLTDAAFGSIVYISKT